MKGKWTKFRHKVSRKLVFPLIGIYVKSKCGIKIEKFKSEIKGPYFVLYNHQTGYDQFILALSFKQAIYQVASDDILSNGFYSRLISYFSKPIPIKKNVSDIMAVKNCIKVAKEGATIAIAPEGNRTYSGETCYFNPAIVSLVKLLKLPVLIYRIEGGYGVLPRWSDKTRKGKSRAFVKRIIEYKEIEKLSKEELHDLLKKELYLNEYDSLELYKGKKKAEYLERVAYVCPKCGLSEFYSSGNFIKCKKCQMEVEYLDNKKLKGKDFDFQFDNYLEWYKYQEKFINNLDLISQKDVKFYDDLTRIYKVVPCKKKILIDKKCLIKLYGGKIELDYNNEKKIFKFEEIEGVSVLGRNKLNIYYNGELFQFKGEKRFNAMKYLNFFHRYKNQLKGDGDEFLGL